MPFPSVQLTNFLHQAATDIISILSKLPMQTVPTLQAGDDINNSILEIAALLKRIETIPTAKAINKNKNKKCLLF